MRFNKAFIGGVLLLVGNILAFLRGDQGTGIGVDLAPCDTRALKQACPGAFNTGPCSQYNNFQMPCELSEDVIILVDYFGCTTVQQPNPTWKKICEPVLDGYGAAITKNCTKHYSCFYVMSVNQCSTSANPYLTTQKPVWMDTINCQ
jgi:hypothetical protein